MNYRIIFFTVVLFVCFTMMMYSEHFIELCNKNIHLDLKRFVFKFVKLIPPVMKPMKTYNSESIPASNKTLKRILIYTEFFERKPWPMGPIIPNFTQTCGCDFDLCEVTYDHQMFEMSDLVIFHARDMPDSELPSLNKRRPANQLWMYFVWENPYYAPDVKPLDKFFNLSSSYRTSSDVWFPYRFHLRKNIPVPVNQTRQNFNYAAGKTRLVAMASSHCADLPRFKLANKLHEFGLQIDNLGTCRKPYLNPRPISRAQAPFHEYKFIFSAENRLCRDYITEKYWDYPFDKNANVIPIVFGGGNYSNPELAIPGSFIDALKFSSPKKLADYLLLLDKNDTMYNEYFMWKKHWTFWDVGRPKVCHFGLWLCNICQKLHDQPIIFRKNPLKSTIDAKKECGTLEDSFYQEWINKVN